MRMRAKGLGGAVLPASPTHTQASQGSAPHGRHLALHTSRFKAQVPAATTQHAQDQAEKNQRYLGLSLPQPGSPELA